MATEREMLEYAAKACEYSLCIRKDGAVSIDMINEWNPLTNSADCAAMCAKLEIDTTWFPTHIVCEIVTKDDKHLWHVSEFEDHDNPEAAWRYAATQVAAKIGGMK